MSGVLMKKPWWLLDREVPLGSSWGVSKGGFSLSAEDSEEKGNRYPWKPTLKGRPVLEGIKIPA